MYIPEQRDGLINVLMAEDNEDDALISKLAFEYGRLKTNMFIVDDGSDVLDFVYNKGQFEDVEKYPRPDVILLDINMPKYSGLQVIEKISCDNNLRDIPCVMLTSSRNTDDIVKSYELGCASFIPKPVEFEDFQRIVESFNFFWVAMNEKISCVPDEANNASIVIIDDSGNEDEVMTLTNVLSNKGYKNIVIAKSVEGALAKTKNSALEIIVIDVRHPSINGRGICKKIGDTTLQISGVIAITEDNKSVEIVKSDYFENIDYLVKSSDYRKILCASP